MRKFGMLFSLLTIMLWTVSCFASDVYKPQEGIWKAKDFKFHTGEVFPELNIGYTTLGNPAGEPVLILHGTTGTGKGMLNPAFGGELFGPGQVLDADKYYIILTDAIGTGRSSKPSDGLKAHFPNYNYDDMVQAQYRLVTEGLGIKHLRAIIGFSMGGMQTWLWGIEHPKFMDAIVPMASLPTAMSGRNWITRKFISDSIRLDPAWKDGNYAEQPKSAQFASIYYNFATNLGTQALAAKAPTSEAGNAMIEKAFAAPFALDANDMLYQWESSADYNPVDLEAIEAYVLCINAADDERNPVELKVMEKAGKRIAHCQEFLIPGSAETSGHATTANAKWWKDAFAEFIKTVPHK